MKIATKALRRRKSDDGRFRASLVLAAWLARYHRRPA